MGSFETRILLVLALVASAYGSGLLYPKLRPRVERTDDSSPCEHSACYPQSNNLLIGRAANITASSTCGTNGSQKYCTVSHLEDKKRCFRCDSTDAYVSNPGLSHRIENVIQRFTPGTEARSWWQSEAGVEDVTIQVDLDAEYDLTHVIMFFKTFRPAAMYIERSTNFGQTWSVYRYFAYDCAGAFPGIPTNEKSLGDVICDSRYSSLDPSSDGELIFRVISTNNSRHMDPNSQEIKNLRRVTNLRIHFTKLHTLGEDRIGTSPEVSEKYYYAIYEMIVRGSCSCNGHASRCLPTDAAIDSPAGMVHGKCDCVHHTSGNHCEKCEDGFKAREGQRWIGNWDVCQSENGGNDGDAMGKAETNNRDGSDMTGRAMVEKLLQQVRDHGVFWTQKIWNFMA